MNTENITINETEKEFDFNTFDWDKWNRDMKKAIDGILELTQEIKASKKSEEAEKTKVGESNGCKMRWWEKCFTRAKRYTQAKRDS